MIRVVPRRLGGLLERLAKRWVAPARHRCAPALVRTERSRGWWRRWRRARLIRRRAWASRALAFWEWKPGSHLVPRAAAAGNSPSAVGPEAERCRERSLAGARVVVAALDRSLQAHGGVLRHAILIEEEGVLGRLP
jgi:hypothetical protein